MFGGMYIQYFREKNRENFSDIPEGTELGNLQEIGCRVGYNEFDFFLENKEYRPFDGYKIEI